MRKEKNKTRAPKKPSPPKIKLPLDLTAGTPEDIWNDYFSKRVLPRKEVAGIILQLHTAKKNKHVIAAVTAAIIHGQSQPWMYEVLAISMKLEKYPQREIDRVMSSRIDFTGKNIPSMLYAAAHLSRFDSNALALRMYRQVSEIDSTRPEPYVMGLKIAKKLKDYDSIAWAASGVLTSVWTRDHLALHAEAKDAAAQAVKELLAMGKKKEAEAITQLVRLAKSRDLVIQLNWTGNGDLDLFVEEPLGTVCSYKNPQSRGGGVLVHDGYGPNQSNCHEDYVCAQGVPGIYRLRVKHVGGNIVGKRARLTIIRYQGTDREKTEQIIIPLKKSGSSVRLALKKGRREELLSGMLHQTRPVFYKEVRRGSLFQMLGEEDAGRRRARHSFAASRNRNAILQRNGGPQVGFTPVISTLTEGVTMSAMAVISGDRRYVRLSVAPSFNVITDVFTFSFVNNGGNPTGNPGIGGGRRNGN